MKHENKLLKAVHSDLQIKYYLCGCSALGLINKFATGPLWRLLEPGIHILGINKHYQKMFSLFLIYLLMQKNSCWVAKYFLKMLNFLKMMFIIR